MLILKGYVRAQTLSANDFMHITGWKDFRIKKIDLLPDPFKDNSKSVGAVDSIKVFIPEKEQVSVCN